MSEENKINISPLVKKLFWDADKEKLDADLHKKSIVERVINYGTLTEWKWLSSVYGKDIVLNIVSKKDKFSRKNIRPTVARLASILFK
jgi:hypothetical protein